MWQDIMVTLFLESRSGKARLIPSPCARAANQASPCRHNPPLQHCHHTHPSWPVRVALHLGKHRVTGLKYVFLGHFEFAQMTMLSHVPEWRQDLSQPSVTFLGPIYTLPQAQCNCRSPGSCEKSRIVISLCTLCKKSVAIKDTLSGTLSP